MWLLYNITFVKPYGDTVFLELRYSKKKLFLKKSLLKKIEECVHRTQIPPFPS